MLLRLLRFYLRRETLTSLLKPLRLYLSSTMPPSSSSTPPPFDPTRPATPISYPIKTLADLNSRAFFSSFHFAFNKSSSPLRSSPSLPDRPRLIVCHDMAGGYGDDKWIQGGNNPDAYSIWHWYLIDVFIYFSHILVTLPPPCWTNTAHKHGVKVLGTFITEWEEGRLVCDELLSTKESVEMYADRLVELAVALGFDGWLINMEVELDLGQILNLKWFVSYLTERMHSALPGSLVIWYDSITTDGKLNWQDQLNEMNKPFFDVSDGIFVNYTWQKNYPNRSAVVAGDRKFDVYMGVDVFGRNTFGGGQWNTNVALDVLKNDGVSAAIFAPGWIYETKQPPDFQTAQNHWWSLVEKSWGIRQNYPIVLPFYSNFDQGHGYHVSEEGRQVSGSSWCNISSQGFQPLLAFTNNSGSDGIQVHVDYQSLAFEHQKSLLVEEFHEIVPFKTYFRVIKPLCFKEASYNGGGNITFKGNLKDNADFTTRLFQGHLLLGDLPLHFTYSVKSENNSRLGLFLSFVSSQNEKKSVYLVSWNSHHVSSKLSTVIRTQQLEKPETAPGWVIEESSIRMKGHILTGIHALCYKSKPESDERMLKAKSSLGSSSAYKSTDYYAVLGHISMKLCGQNSVFPPSDKWLVQGQYIQWTSVYEDTKHLSLKITWEMKDGNDSEFSTYNIYVEKLADGKSNGGRSYLGVARVEAFYVYDLAVPSDISSIKFIIQACGGDGSSQKLDDSPVFLLDTGA